MFNFYFQPTLDASLLTPHHHYTPLPRFKFCSENKMDKNLTNDGMRWGPTIRHEYEEKRIHFKSSLIRSWFSMFVAIWRWSLTHFFYVDCMSWNSVVWPPINDQRNELWSEEQETKWENWFFIVVLRPCLYIYIYRYFFFGIWFCIEIRK